MVSARFKSAAGEECPRGAGGHRSLLRRVPGCLQVRGVPPPHSTNDHGPGAWCVILSGGPGVPADRGLPAH